eukprot:TRINITY_DN2071_c0_g3_i1.p1 TRINITY_DN2071_c0_g3~~TRINITY_DN2071_c0_g3_i1.p1  ORF type:complete len:762 (+),score=290.59 TRINITY_DN2071_c0_g3_i1:96-2381(+)
MERVDGELLETPAGAPTTTSPAAAPAAPAEEETSQKPTVEPVPPPLMEDDRFSKLNELLDRTNLFAEHVQGEMKINADDETTARDAQGERKWEMPLPKSLSGGELKCYQRVGFEWLTSLYLNGVNGILADEMGLGKTIMTISYFAGLLEAKITGPHLIVVPLSTLRNWEKEFAKWVPRARVTVYHGKKELRAEMRQSIAIAMGHKRLEKIKAKYRPEFFNGPEDKFLPGYGIFLTTYETAISDIEWFKKHKWQTLVVDEAQRLKNFECLLIRSLRRLDTSHRILLTGTPLQNNLAELWSILNFIMPRVFDDLNDFTSWFDMDAIEARPAEPDAEASEGSGEPVHNLQQTQVVNKLHAILRPFMLRRTKSQLKDELPMPEKREIAVFCDLTPVQREQYRMIHERRLHTAVGERDAAAGGTKLQSETSLNNIVMQLRKVCNHPMLFPEFDPFATRVIREKVTEETWERDWEGDRFYIGKQTKIVEKEVRSYNPEDPKHVAKRAKHIVQSCSKMQLLDKMLTKLKQQGHKVLIFSQMTEVLDLIDDYLAHKGWDSEYRIDGRVGVADRQSRIEEFNTSPDAFVFLLSTRAGGLGINLTAADTVIIYDSDWNPQNDLQAQARCHRIGQTKAVVVYRLVTRGTVESYLMERATRKLQLENIVIEKANLASRRMQKLNQEELKAAMQLAPPEKHLGEDAAHNDKLLADLLDRDKLFNLKRGADPDDKSTPKPKRARGRALAPLSPRGSGGSAGSAAFEVLPSFEAME